MSNQHHLKLFKLNLVIDFRNLIYFEGKYVIAARAVILQRMDDDCKASLAQKQTNLKLTLSFTKLFLQIWSGKISYFVYLKH